MRHPAAGDGGFIVALDHQEPHAVGQRFLDDRHLLGPERKNANQQKKSHPAHPRLKSFCRIHACNLPNGRQDVNGERQLKITWVSLKAGKSKEGRKDRLTRTLAPPPD